MNNNLFENRAERNKEKAEELVDDIKKAIEEGDTKKAERLIRKANRKINRAEKADDNMDLSDIKSEISTFNNELTDFKKEEEETDKKTDTSSDTTDTTDTKSEETPDIEVKDTKNRIKSKDFKFINKVKIVGDEVSNEEVDKFLETTKDYIDEYWNELKKGEVRKGTYHSAYSDFDIKIKKSLGVITFLYKEGNVDKVKLKLSKRDFKKANKKEDITEEIDQVIKSENIDKAVDSHYEKEEDRKDILNPVKTEQSPITSAPVVPVVAPVIKEKTDKIVNVLTTPNPNFSKQAVNLLVSEELNIGSSNTDEDKIFNFFINNSKNLMVSKNVDDILINYRKAKAIKTNENFIGDIADSTSRAFQSVVDTKSDGVVKDLMNAFNTDSNRCNKDMKILIDKITNAFQIQINKATTKMNMKKEDIGLTDVGMVAGGLYGVKKIAPKLLPRLLGLGGVSGVSAVGAETTAVATGGGLGSTILTGLCSPWFWIPLAVVGAAWGSKYLYDSFSEQQNQIATIFILMYASGSKTFKNECHKAGLIFTNPVLKTKEFANALQDAYKANESRNYKYIESFESYKKRSL